jgi:membrane fusion protein, copper/silver efflux system
VVMAAVVGLFAVAGAAAAQSAVGAGDEPAVQRVEIEVTGRGFQPATLELVAGVPADLVFTRTTASGCAAEVQITELGVARTALPQDEPVTIRITVKKPGSYTFACGMNMLRGTIVVK